MAFEIQSSVRFARRVFLGMLVPAMLLTSGCGSNSKTAAAPAAPATPPPTAVVAVMVTTKNVPIYIDQIGRCASPEIVAVRPQASGQIVKIGFDEGAEVKIGDPLFMIDPAPYQAALDQAKAEVEVNDASLKQAEAVLEQNRAQLGEAETDVESNESALKQSQAVLEQYRAQLSEAEADLEQNRSRQVMNDAEWKRAQGLVGVISQTDFDSKKMSASAGEQQIRSNQAGVVRYRAQITQGLAAIGVADAKIKSSKGALVRYRAQITQGLAAVEVAKARIKSSQAAVRQAEINLKYTEIKSPINGRTGQRMVDLGNVVNAGAVSTTTLLTIQRMDPIYAEFSIPERELPRVHKGMKSGTLKVECRIPETSLEPRDGKVIFVDNAVQEGTGTIRLRASIENKDRQFWPGQFVKVRLIFETRENATLIPASAAQLGQTGPFVFVVKPDSTAELRPVKLGLRYDDFISIDDGIKSGETVVLKGQLMLQPGAKVSVDAPAKDPAAEKKTGDDKAAPKPVEEKK